MKKAFDWSITIIGIICLVFFAGVLTGRNTATVPMKVPEKTETTTSTAQTEFTNLININTADEDLLATLPGIGDVLAKRIVAYREENGPFISISHLRAVEGIGAGKIEAIIDLICTED